MAWNLKNPTKNQIVIENEDSLNPLLYTIHKLNSDQIFEAVDSYPTLPTNSLAASSSITIDLATDNVYKLIIDGSPDTEYYFLLDYNIKICERDFIKELLCNTCDPCASAKFTKDIRNKLVFNAIKNNIYWIWNKWVQTQSVTDLIVPPNGKIVSVADLLAQLQEMCAACSSGTCDDCGRIVSINSGCGCS